MSANTDIQRIKNAKTKLAEKLTAMGLDGEGLVDELIDEVDGITVHNYSGYADDDVTVEDEGTESATYNLDAGYYKNSFMLSHPDSHTCGGGTLDILCYANWLMTQDPTVTDYGGELGNTCVDGYYMIDGEMAGVWNQGEESIEKDYIEVTIDGNHYCIGRIPAVPVDCSFVDIAVPYDGYYFILETSMNCSFEEIGDIYDGDDRVYKLYRITNITDGAMLEFSYSE